MIAIKTPTDARFAAHTQRFSLLAGAFVMLVGALVLIGWTFDVNLLKSVYGGIAMKANTALSLLLAGVALAAFGRAERDSYARRIGESCAAIVALIGALTLSQHLGGWSLEIDQLLFLEAPGEAATTSPGRMGPNASTCFILAGTALLLLYTQRRIALAQGLAILVMLFALLPIVGYAYRVEALYAIARYTGIALHTAMALFILGLGILAARPDQGIAAVISAERAGGIVARRLLVAGIVVPFLLGWLSLMGQHAGYYGMGFGTAALVVTIIALSALIVWQTAARVNRIEEERLSTELALGETEERFRAMADQAPVLIWVSGADKRREWVNKPWLDFTGRTLEQERGAGWTEGVHPDDREALHAARDAAFAAHRGFTIEYRLRRHDGQFRWVIDSGVPRFLASGEFAGYIGSSIDISERKASEEERAALLANEQEARAQAEEASRLKDEFLATLSHELRNPLNAMLGWVHVLRSGTLPAEQTAGALETIERNVRAQAKLIEDLLDVSRIVTGKLRLDIRPLEPIAVAEAAVASARPAAEAKGIQLQTLLDPNAGAVAGDPDRLQQVIWNLISNAIKFTPKGGRVQVRLQRAGSNVEISVSDTGEGIPPAFLPHVFDRFRQADGSTRRKHGGLGLGLAIVRHLVELHGGTVEAESAGAGQGATFRVKLPVLISRTHASPGPALQADAAWAGLPRLDNLRILVVDDEPDSRSLLVAMLAPTGAETRMAGDMEEALRTITAWPPDLLVSDIGMPGGDGCDLIREVRRRDSERDRPLPAVALTAHARAEDRLRVLAAGFQTHLAKPVEPAELIAVLASLAGRARGS